MKQKILVPFLLGLLVVPSCAYAGALDVLNTVGNIAGVISDTQRTLAGGKPGEPVVAGVAGKHGSPHVVSHVKRHK